MKAPFLCAFISLINEMARNKALWQMLWSREFVKKNKSALPQLCHQSHRQSHRVFDAKRLHFGHEVPSLQIILHRIPSLRRRSSPLTSLPAQSARSVPLSGGCSSLHKVPDRPPPVRRDKVEKCIYKVVPSSCIDCIVQ